MEGNGSAVIAFLIVIGLVLYFLPTIIAFARSHHYRWIIFAINLIAGLSGLGYLVAFVWALWPRQTAAVDIIAGDLTTNSDSANQHIYRKLGHSAKAFREGAGLAASPSAPPTNPSKTREALESLQELGRLRDSGVISEPEFDAMKQRLLEGQVH